MAESRQEKKWVIRKALVADAKALSDCMHAAYATYTSRLDNQPLPPLTVNYEEEIRNYPVWIAESEGKLVGGLILQEDEKKFQLPM
jgi:L-amino acid N-acyltransferase YncA